jgi:AAA domain
MRIDSLLSFEKQLGLLQNPLAYPSPGVPPSHIELPGLPRGEPMRHQNFRHALIVRQTGTRHRQQKLHCYLSRDLACAQMEPRIYWELTMLIILGGLPGTGKTTIARELARQLGAVHVRIDSVEEAILDSGVLSSPINNAGYRVGNAVAADNLRSGRTVIADSVNPIPLSRDAWVEVANRAQVSAIEIEVTCSDTWPSVM